MSKQTDKKASDQFLRPHKQGKMECQKKHLLTKKYENGDKNLVTIMKAHENLIYLATE